LTSLIHVQIFTSLAPIPWPVFLVLFTSPYYLKDQMQTEGAVSPLFSFIPFFSHMFLNLLESHPMYLHPRTCVKPLASIKQTPSHFIYNCNEHLSQCFPVSKTSTSPAPTHSPRIHSKLIPIKLLPLPRFCRATHPQTLPYFLPSRTLARRRQLCHRPHRLSQQASQALLLKLGFPKQREEMCTGRWQRV